MFHKCDCFRVNEFFPRGLFLDEFRDIKCIFYIADLLLAVTRNKSVRVATVAHLVEALRYKSEGRGFYPDGFIEIFH
jgi:hypothetical protein